MKTLTLPLKRKWFDMTKAGIKPEDYREITPYWIKRLVDTTKEPTWGINDFVREFEYHGNELKFLEKYGKKFDYNRMTLGYPSYKNNPERIQHYPHAGIEIRTGNPEWGAEPGKLYFVIKHHFNMIHITAAEIIHNGNQSSGRPVNIDVTIPETQLEAFRQRFMAELLLNNDYIVNFVYTLLK